MPMPLSEISKMTHFLYALALKTISGDFFVWSWLQASIAFSMILIRAEWT